MRVVEEIAELKKEAEALKAIKEAMGTPSFAEKVFEKVFNTDIHRLLSMQDMWKTRKPPVPLSYTDYSLPSNSEIAKLAVDDQKIWDLAANIAVFKHSYFPPSVLLVCGVGTDDRLDRLSARWEAIQTPEAVQVLTFDKDDVDTLDFVSSTANIRSTIFSIPTKSKFDIKRNPPTNPPVPGNICPLLFGVEIDCRNGGKYYPCYSDNKRYCRGVMCSSSDTCVTWGIR